MEYLSYILKFLYRIKWWLMLVPILLTTFAILATKNMSRTYNTSMTIYTGIISGYTVEATSEANINLSKQSTTLDNILNIITSESTLKNVSLRLYAENMMYGDPNHDNTYIKAENYKALLKITPKEIQKLINKKDEKRTIANLKAYERPDSKNFVYGLFYWFHPDYSYSSLSEKIKVTRIGDSDMVQIDYSNSDPGIAYNTLRILNEEYTGQYQELRFGETNDVIKFYEEELAKLAKTLRLAEDSLTQYNIEKKIINYGEQTKQITILNSDIYLKQEDFELNYNSARVAVSELEKRIQNHIMTLKNNNQFLAKLQNISDLASKITELETFGDKIKSAKEIESISTYKKQLKKAENDFTVFSETYSAYKASKEGISNDIVVSNWLEEVIRLEKAKAQLKVMDQRKNILDEQYGYYSPIGSVIRRKERNIGFIEQNYMSMLNSLNAARLRQKNIQMSSAALKVVNPPIFPISPEATKRRSIITSIFFGSIILVLGFFLLIELLDRTLRDKIRAKRLTSLNVIGAFPGNNTLRFRNFTKARNHIATKFINNELLRNLPSDQKRIINLISTGNKDGKSYIGQQLEEYWTSIGVNVSRITWHNDFSINSKEYLLAQSINNLTTDQNADIYIVEYPSLSECAIPPSLLREASINLVIAKANRTWKFTDQAFIRNLTNSIGEESKIFLLLNTAQKDVVESFTGLLPPINKLRKLIYKYSQFGLTASE